jgi:Basic region leucine zipper
MSSMTQVNGRISHLDSEDKPERSRNAKAQARHRAKRKAYIEQLESTVTKLQTTLGKSKCNAVKFLHY